MHVEDVVGADRVGSGWRRRPIAPTTEHEAERRAQAGAAFELEEGEVVAPGKQPDLPGGDALVADGAPMPAREREEVVQRIHPA